MKSLQDKGLAMFFVRKGKKDVYMSSVIHQPIISACKTKMNPLLYIAKL